MHFDRFSDVARQIYNSNSKNQIKIEIPDLSDKKITAIPTNHQEIESGPLNCKEVKLQQKSRKDHVQQQHHQLDHHRHHQEEGKSQSRREEKTHKNEEKEKPSKSKSIRNDIDADIDIDILLSAAEFDKKEQEMKDLDRLVNDLLQEASTIDVPYHTREDGLAFRYCTQDDILKNRHKLGGHGHGDTRSIPAQEFNPLRVEQDSHNHFKPSDNNITAKTKTSSGSEHLLNKSPSDPIKIKPSIINSSFSSPLATSSPIQHNWSTNNGNGRQNQKPVEEPERDEYPKPWSKVTVEHDSSPITWTQMPLPDRDRRENNYSGSNNSNSISIPITHEKSQQQLRQEEINRLRDWNLFQDAKFQEDFSNISSSNSSSGLLVKESPRRQVKYARSFSAGNFEDPNSDEWLAKQMTKLKLKRSASIRQHHPLINRSSNDAPAPTPAWLIELKQRNSSAKSIEKLEKQQVVENVKQSVSIPVTIERSSRQSPIDQPPLQQQVLLSDSEFSGTPTPRFPVCPATPYLNKSAASRHVETHIQRRGHTTVHNYSSKSAPVTDDDSEEEDEIAKIMYNRKHEDDLKFTVDTSSAWYKPNATREETINALANRGIGTFIIRNSNSFPGAYGLAIKFDDYNVRHFLIEPCKSGVKIRGSAIEPVFSSLSALVYAHTIQPLALPVKLKLHTEDNLIPTNLSQSTTSKLLSQGAACQLLFLGSNDVEMLTGTSAIERSVTKKMSERPVLVNLRLSKSGLVLTDVMRQNFFRHHHNLSSIIHAGIDPLSRSITVHGKVCKLFGIIVNCGRRNDVLVLAEYESNQPASSIVAFFLRVIQWRSV